MSLWRSLTAGLKRRSRELSDNRSLSQNAALSARIYPDLPLCLCESVCVCVSVFSQLTDEWIRDVGPVDAVLQLQLVMWLNVEQQVLVKTHSSDQVRPVGTL